MDHLSYRPRQTVQLAPWYGATIYYSHMWFYDQYSTEQQIKPPHNLLKVEGASGQYVPYLGYVEVINHLSKTLEVNT